MTSRKNRLLSDMRWWEWALLFAGPALYALLAPMLTDQLGDQFRRDANIFTWGVIFGAVLARIADWSKRRFGPKS